MKKIYLFAFGLLAQFSQAQLSENFDAAATLPTGWVAFRGTNNAGTLQDWAISTTRSYSPDNSAFVRYENVASGMAEDWLVTPQVDLLNRTDALLTFYGGQQYTDDYATVYEVKVSTTSQTDHASFTTVATYGETDFTDITTLELTSLQTIDLSAYDGQQIYVAFVMSQDDGDNWFIDDVNITGTLSNESFNGNRVSVYPNPTNGIVSVQATVALAKIEIFNLVGNLIKTIENNTQVDISEVASGTYFIKTTSTDGHVNNQKIVKY